MSELPIRFTRPNYEMVGTGIKTCTRRILKTVKLFQGKPVDLEPLSPYEVGDILWTREPLRAVPLPTDCGPHPHLTCIAYEYGGIPTTVHGTPLTPYWKSGEYLADRFMKRYYARIFLEVLDVKICRLQDMTVDEAVAEGANHWMSWYSHRHGLEPFRDMVARAAKRELPYSISYYAEMWDEIYADEPAKRWDKNPWVAHINFVKLDEEKSSQYRRVKEIQHDRTDADAT